jgi:hypothetical protein
MAQPPRPNPLHGATHVAPSPPKPVAPPSAPLTGAHVAAATVPPEQPPLMRMNIHGIPPAPNMAPPPNVDEERVNEATEAEMQAGKEALAVYAKRTQAEHDYGKKLIDKLNRPRVTQESKEE